MPHTIAMWSGPRNISTAMMRSWENRADTVVHDEPFYAHYLTHTHHVHPGADEVIAAYETDWRKIAQRLTAPPPEGASISYQKHMTHHMLPHIDLAWMLPLTNCFLIREPRRVLLSLLKVFDDPQLDQTGLPEQRRIFEFVKRERGTPPPVIDAQDVLQNPRRMLSALCAAINVPFDEAMLRWPAGKRASDGNWARYWYAAVEQSTGFVPYKTDDTPVPEDFAELLRECELLYEAMRAHKLSASS